MPRTFLPYMFFSFITPNCRQTAAVLVREMPQIWTPALRKAA